MKQARTVLAGLVLAIPAVVCGADDTRPAAASSIGREVSIARHLGDGEEYHLPMADLLRHGKDLFNANWTEQEGGGSRWRGRWGHRRPSLSLGRCPAYHG